MRSSARDDFVAWGLILGALGFVAALVVVAMTLSGNHVHLHVPTEKGTPARYVNNSPQCQAAVNAYLAAEGIDPTITTDPQARQNANEAVCPFLPTASASAAR